MAEITQKLNELFDLLIQEKAKYESGNATTQSLLGKIQAREDELDRS